MSECLFNFIISIVSYYTTNVKIFFDTSGPTGASLFLKVLWLFWSLIIVNISQVYLTQGGVPRTYDFRCPWLSYWQFPFYDPLKCDLSVSMTVFVSDIRWNIGQFPFPLKKKPPKKSPLWAETFLWPILHWLWTNSDLPL